MIDAYCFWMSNVEQEQAGLVGGSRAPSVRSRMTKTSQRSARGFAMNVRHLYFNSSTATLIFGLCRFPFCVCQNDSCFI